MPLISVTTFNCENLMMRCDFRSQRIPNLSRLLTNIADPAKAEEVDAVFDVLSEDDRTLTAKVLTAARADVCILQEVENLVALTAFHNRYLKRCDRRGYPYRMLFEGNDGRGIDVALLSRLKPVSVKSHASLTYRDIGLDPPRDYPPEMRVFRRDCLEVTVEKSGARLTLFGCHFKSMQGGRAETSPVREAEAWAVRRLIEQRFSDPASADWIVLGDFNDYFEVDGVPVDDCGLSPLLDGGFSVDMLTMLQPDPLQRWTHFYAHGDVYGALDHMFLSPALAARNRDATVRITRAGQPLRAQRYQGERFGGVGWSVPKASDHCPLSVALKL